MTKPRHSRCTYVVPRAQCLSPQVCILSQWFKCRKKDWRTAHSSDWHTAHPLLLALRVWNIADREKQRRQTEGKVRCNFTAQFMQDSVPVAQGCVTSPGTSYLRQAHLYHHDQNGSVTRPVASQRLGARPPPAKARPPLHKLNPCSRVPIVLPGPLTKPLLPRILPGSGIFHHFLPLLVGPKNYAASAAQGCQGSARTHSTSSGQTSRGCCKFAAIDK
jgi:hypothetical protein